MNPETINVSVAQPFAINTTYLPERFTVIGALRREGTNDYVVIGMENNETYCSWLYNPNCGFVYGHYRLTREQALKDLVERG